MKHTTAAKYVPSGIYLIDSIVSQYDMDSNIGILLLRLSHVGVPTTPTAPRTCRKVSPPDMQ